MLFDRDTTETGTANGLPGCWVNARGSVMELHCAGDHGALTGAYTSGVRDKHTYGVKRYANATTVVFTVNFESSASIGAWADHFDAQKDEIDMLWHLVAGPTAGEVWDTTFAGFDTFRRSA